MTAIFFKLKKYFCNIEVAKNKEKFGKNAISHYICKKCYFDAKSCGKISRAPTRQAVPPRNISGTILIIKIAGCTSLLNSHFVDCVLPHINKMPTNQYFWRKKQFWWKKLRKNLQKGKCSSYICSVFRNYDDKWGDKVLQDWKNLCTFAADFGKPKINYIIKLNQNHNYGKSNFLWWAGRPTHYWTD